MRFLILPGAISLFASPFLCHAQDTPNAEAQAPALYVCGTVKTYEERDSLPGASIAVSIPGNPATWWC